jgi:hypothetical protein
MVGGVIPVPEGDQFIAGLANILAVEDRTGEDAGDVQAVDEGSIGAILNIERAIKQGLITLRFCQKRLQLPYKAFVYHQVRGEHSISRIIGVDWLKPP